MNLDALGPDFRSKLKNLRIIYMKDNKIANVSNLEKLKGLDLVELNCSGNPFKDRLGSDYTERIRGIFPNLQVLDDKPMPKKIGFDDDTSPSASSLPPSIPKFIKSEEAGTLVLQFLEQYFKLYDSDNRQPLLDAYDENAMMSMSCFGNRDSMAGYLEDSRNFKRIQEYRAKKTFKYRSFTSGLLPDQAPKDPTRSYNLHPRPLLHQRHPHDVHCHRYLQGARGKEKQQILTLQQMFPGCTAGQWLLYRE